MSKSASDAVRDVGFFYDVVECKAIRPGEDQPIHHGKDEAGCSIAKGVFLEFDNDGRNWAREPHIDQPWDWSSRASVRASESQIGYLHDDWRKLSTAHVLRDGDSGTVTFYGREPDLHDLVEKQPD
jgi:hypothetical protein